MKKRKPRPDIARWLKRTNRTQAGWARELGLKTPMTVWHWIKKGVDPHDIYKERIRERTPDCPILKP